MTSTAKRIKQQLDKEISTFLNNNDAENWHFKIKPNLTYEDFLSDKMLIIVAIRKGIPYSLFALIQHNTPFSDKDWASFLDISAKSLHRYKQASQNFKSMQSEKIIEMAEVTQAGLDVFDNNMDTLKLWLNTPNYALGSLKPIELLKDSYGKEMVLGELTRINHGILA
jgi:putative toxin-antitoxin system antitoxin component (TIGR02293 family)